MVTTRKGGSGSQLALFGAWVWVILGPAVAGCGAAQPKKPSLAGLDGLITERKLAEAEELCRRIVQADPGDSEARGSLARVLCLRGDAALAELGFLERGRKEPATAPRYAAARKLFEAAVVEGRAALAASPGNGRVRGTLGLALYRTGQREQAVEELKSALKAEPQSAEINNTLGLICYETGRLDEALGYYRAALALQGDLPEACYNLAVLYEEDFGSTGKAASRDEAIRYYGLYRRYRRGDKDGRVEKAIRELEAKAPAGGRGAGAPGPAAAEK